MQETQETQVQSLGWEDPSEQKVATHSSVFTWKIPWTEEPGGLTVQGVTESDMTEHPHILLYSLFSIRWPGSTPDFVTHCLSVSMHLASPWPANPTRSVWSHFTHPLTSLCSLSGLHAGPATQQGCPHLRALHLLISFPVIRSARCLHDSAASGFDSNITFVVHHCEDQVSLCRSLMVERREVDRLFKNTVEVLRWWSSG